MDRSTKPVTVSMEVDRDMYNAFKSVCYGSGVTVKEALIDHIKDTIKYQGNK